MGLTLLAVFVAGLGFGLGLGLRQAKGYQDAAMHALDRAIDAMQGRRGE